MVVGGTRRARSVELKGLDGLREARGLTLVVGSTSEVARGASCNWCWGRVQRRARWGERRNGWHTPNETPTRVHS